MSEQATLPGLEAQPSLTERQAHALAIIRSRGPIRSEDLGAELYPRVHEHDRLRTYGRAIGDALAGKGLVRYVRDCGWVAAEDAPGPKASSQLGQNDPLPEGF